MAIFIAKTYDGKTESVVLAENKDLANAYWQGKEIYPHSTVEIKEENLKTHPTGVIPIINTKEKEIYKNGNFHKYLVIVD